MMSNTTVWITWGPAIIGWLVGTVGLLVVENYKAHLKNQGFSRLLRSEVEEIFEHLAGLHESLTLYRHEYVESHGEIVLPPLGRYVFRGSLDQLSDLPSDCQSLIVRFYQNLDFFEQTIKNLPATRAEGAYARVFDLAVLRVKILLKLGRRLIRSLGNIHGYSVPEEELDALERRGRRGMETVVSDQET